MKKTLKVKYGLKKIIIHDIIKTMISWVRGPDMSWDLERSRNDYELEKEARKKRLTAYADAIQKQTLKKTSEMIEQRVEERRIRGMSQHNWWDITGILPPNLARLESGNRVPTLVVLQKYASALGMHIELKLCDGIEDWGRSELASLFKKYIINDIINKCDWRKIR